MDWYLFIVPYTASAFTYVLYCFRYQLLVEAIDNIVRESVLLRSTMGLPEKDLDEFGEDMSKFHWCNLLRNSYLVSVHSFVMPSVYICFCISNIP